NSRMPVLTTFGSLTSCACPRRRLRRTLSGRLRTATSYRLFDIGSIVRYGVDLIELTSKEDATMRRQLLAALTVALGAAGLGLSAQAASASGLKVSLQLTSHQAGSPTGTKLQLASRRTGR